MPNEQNNDSRDQQAHDCRFISILSGKGGVGKSIIAFNMAERLAAGGKKVLLVDTDFQCGNLHLLANVNCEYGLAQFVGDKLSLKEAITRLKPNLDLLPTAISETFMECYDTMANACFMKKLREHCTDYDFVILDQSSGISNQAIVTAHACDLNILILLPELTSIADCYGLFKMLTRTNLNINCHLLINRIASAEEEEYIREKFTALTERFLLTKPGFLGSLPETELVRQSVARQTAMSEIEPDDPAVQKMNSLADKLGQSLSKHTVTMVAPEKDKKTPVTSDI